MISISWRRWTPVATSFPHIAGIYDDIDHLWYESLTDRIQIDMPSPA
jgi:hypothetical protein